VNRTGNGGIPCSTSGSGVRSQVALAHGARVGVASHHQRDPTRAARQPPPRLLRVSLSSQRSPWRAAGPAQHGGDRPPRSVLSEGPQEAVEVCAEDSEPQSDSPSLKLAPPDESVNRSPRDPEGRSHVRRGQEPLSRPQYRRSTRRHTGWDLCHAMGSCEVTGPSLFHGMDDRGRRGRPWKAASGRWGASGRWFKSSRPDHLTGRHPEGKG